MEADVESYFVKSGQSKKRRGHTVPLRGLATGVLGVPWAETWLKLREQQGLVAEAQGTLFPKLAQDDWVAERQCWLLSSKNVRVCSCGLCDE